MNEDSKSNISGVIERPWFVYICESKSRHYYVGITTDVDNRVKKHNSGQGAKMAIDQHEFILRYTSSAFASKSEARKREIQIKKWSRLKKENLINGIWK